MISHLSVKNYKSLQELDMDLGRMTVLIGANGSGKSNILEAVALCSAAAANKLDHEFLASRGIRVPDNPHFMRSAFEAKHTKEDIAIAVTGGYTESSFADSPVEPKTFHCVLRNEDHTGYSTWRDVAIEGVNHPGDTIKSLQERLQALNPSLNIEAVHEIVRKLEEISRNLSVPDNLQNLLIYSPENTSLRTFETEGQIQPLGIKGEGLFKLLTVLSNDQNKERINEIKKRLPLLDWFDDFEVAPGVSTGERTLNIKDRYLDESLSYFTQKSANEGFLFLLFYFTLFISRETPSFFAIDNIDASLNPKLCSQLLKELVDLAKTHNKQAIVTTHNPAVLDGLDLNDDEQRLYVVSRNKLGHTKVKRVTKQASLPDQKPVRLSEAFLRGYLGGLPGNF
jgi:predicted ATPase